MNGSLTRVPCTIVTGFLGAGKTTLIRHVIANAQGRRLAVIVNEFGDVGIDGEILKGCGNAACPEENIVELANGCLCCTVADEFVPALDAILARDGVEHIVIETSGLALRVAHDLAGLADVAELLGKFEQPNLRTDDLLFSRHDGVLQSPRRGASPPRPLRAPPRLAIRRGEPGHRCQIKF